MIEKETVFLFDTLGLLQYANWIARQRKVSKYLRKKFFVIKDQLMLTFHKNFRYTERLAYRRIPYLERCDTCKKKADALFEIDDSKSWEYHLNKLPTCPADKLISEKTLIEQLVIVSGKKFSFHIPESSTVLWDLSPSELVDRQWVPQEDYEEGIPDIEVSDASFEELLQELLERLHSLETIKKRNDTQLKTSGDTINAAKRYIPAVLYNQLRSVLLNCHSFDKPVTLKSKFTDARLGAWRDALPEADNVLDRLEITIAFLYKNFNANGENVLVLFLRVLSESISTQDACHQKLNMLADKLEDWLIREAS